MAKAPHLQHVCSTQLSWCRGRPTRPPQPFPGLWAQTLEFQQWTHIVQLQPFLPGLLHWQTIWQSVWHLKGSCCLQRKSQRNQSRYVMTLSCPAFKPKARGDLGWVLSFCDLFCGQHLLFCSNACEVISQCGTFWGNVNAVLLCKVLGVTIDLAIRMAW